MTLAVLFCFKIKSYLVETKTESLLQSDDIEQCHLIQRIPQLALSHLDDEKNYTLVFRLTYNSHQPMLLELLK